MVIEEKKFKNIESAIFGTRSVNDPDLLVLKASCTHLADCIYQLLFMKNPLFYLFPIQKHRGPNLTIGHGQTRGII